MIKQSEAVAFINAVRGVLHLGPLPGTYGSGKRGVKVRAWWPHLSEQQLSELQRFKASEESEALP